LNLETIKKNITSKINRDEYCISAINSLLLEVPYNKMTMLGKITFFSLLKNIVKRRKRFHSYSKLYDIELNNIRRINPIIVTGLPRSGTTLLQNILIQNLQYEGIPFWELTNPIPISNNRYLDITFRKMHARIILLLTKLCGPQITPMHPMSIHSYEECWHLFLLTFNVYNFDFQFGLTKYGDFISKNTIERAYKEYESLLKIILHSRTNHNLVLKCPEHMLFTNTIAKVLPKSNIIWIHRDPVKSIISYTNMIYEIQKFYFRTVSIKKISNFVTYRFEKMIEKISSDRKASQLNIIDIKFLDLISKERKTLSYIKSNFNLPSIIDKNKPARNNKNLKSKVIYDLAKQHIHIGSLYKKFESYIDKYDIPKEI
tara:strand:- start:779 stop:1894 length:1116 start_codon:yes stop_codon:yes gene_type:complete